MIGIKEKLKRDKKGKGRSELEGVRTRELHY